MNPAVVYLQNIKNQLEELHQETRDLAKRVDAITGRDEALIERLGELTQAVAELKSSAAAAPAPVEPATPKRAKKSEAPPVAAPAPEPVVEVVAEPAAEPVAAPATPPTLAIEPTTVAGVPAAKAVPKTEPADEEGNLLRRDRAHGAEAETGDGGSRRDGRIDHGGPRGFRGSRVRRKAETGAGLARLKLLLAAALGFLAPSASAGFLPNGAFSSNAAGTTGASFLDASVGARAAAMGGVVAAEAQGAEALFQNPAALARLEPESPSEIALGYDALVETAYQGEAAYARPLGRDGALGAGLVYASQSAQTNYDNFGNATGNFTPLDVAAGAGYARRLGPVAVGAGLKLIRSSLAEQSGTSAAVDLGALAKLVADIGEGPLDVGASVTNLGPPLKLGAAASPLPLNVRAGALWHVSPNFDGALDVVFPVDQDPYVAFGVEARLPAAMVGSTRPWVASLRGGYNQNSGRTVDGFAGATFGGGLDISALRVDYAWIAMGALGMANRITIAFRF